MLRGPDETRCLSYQCGTIFVRPECEAAAGFVLFACGCETMHDAFVVTGLSGIGFLPFYPVIKGSRAFHQGNPPFSFAFSDGASRLDLSCGKKLSYTVHKGRDALVRRNRGRGQEAR